MGSHLIVLGMSYPMNTNMTGFRWFSNRCIRVLWTKVASALEGTTSINIFYNHRILRMVWQLLLNKDISRENALPLLIGTKYTLLLQHYNVVKVYSRVYVKGIILTDSNCKRKSKHETIVSLRI